MPWPLRRPPAAGWLIGAAAIAAAMAGAARAADADADPAFDLTLEQLRNVKVQTATKTATPLYATPAVVTLITADDIARYGYRTLAEALSHVAGFIESDDQLNHNFGVRGSSAGAQSASRGIKLLLDGQPVAFRSTQEQWTGLEFVPMNMIERIEIVRGPVSVLYGADALLAAVNVITRHDGTQLRAAASHEWDGGGRDSSLLSASGSVQGPDSWLAWGAQGAHDDRAGLALPRVSPDYLRAPRTSAVSDDASPRSFYVRGGWTGLRDEAVASVFWQRQDSDNVFANLNPLLQPPTHVALQQGYARLDYSHQLNDENSLRTSVSYGQGQPASGDRIETGAANYYLLRAIGYKAVDASAEWLWQPGAQTSWMLGADLLDDRETLESFQRHSLIDGSNFQLSQPGQATLHNSGLYAQWQFPVAAGWQGIVGGRADHHSEYGNQRSYRAGVVGTLPAGWGLKLLSGTAFQAPSAELLYRTAVQPGDVRGNPDLAPQRSKTTEVELTAPPVDHWNGTLTLYHTQVSDLVMLQQQFFNLVAVNASDSNVNGVELELRYQRGWLNAYANASHANTTVGINRYTLVPLAQRAGGELFPRNSANAGASASLLDQRLTLSVDNRWVGPRPAATANVLLANQDYELSGYVDTTLTARWAVDGRSQVRVQVRDLFNSRYVDPGVGGIDYPSLGRRYELQYEYRF